MAITTADIKLLASQVMSDVPEGGGAPTGNVIPDGASNALFPDISEAARAGGRIYIRQVSASIQSADTDTYMDGNVIVASPPNDPNVSITIMKAPGVFARRTAVANAIESYLVRGSMWGGYLLENHVVNMRRIELLQRPGASLPPVGRTLVLVFNEGTPGEVVQFVRTTRVEVETRTFTEATGGGTADFQADVVKCDISDKLRYNFPGSPASRSFAGQGGKTVVRDTTVADAGSYAGVVPLRLPLAIGDSTLFVSSIYTQLVPNARTESIALDQKPAAQRTLTLATAPRNVSVGAAPHSMRIKVGQENRGFSWTQMLRPLPAAGTVNISYRALGNWYTVQDDGAGVLTGAGVGTINYLTGSLALTLPSLPDVNSAIIFSWGEKTGFVNRSGQAGFRAPEYAFKFDHDTVKPGTVSLKWLSGGVLQTVTDNSTGGLLGPAAGEVNYATGTVFIRPTAMLDAGGEFVIDYQRAVTVTKTVVPSVDAGGFATIALDTVPVAGSVSVRWITVRSVSDSSGASSGGTAAGKSTSNTGGGTGGGTSTIQVPTAASRPNSLDLYINANTSYEGGGALNITVTAERAVIGDQSVFLSITGTGITPADYVLTHPGGSTNQLVILNGQRQVAATLQLVDDGVVEGRETAVVALHSPSSGVALGNVVSKEIYLNDPTASPPAVVPSQPAVVPTVTTTRTPVVITRIQAGLATSAGTGRYQPKMFPGGIRTATGDVVFVGIPAYLDDLGWGYSVPDGLAATPWTEIDINIGYKSIGFDGVLNNYNIWGRVLTGATF